MRRAARDLQKKKPRAALEGNSTSASFTRL